MFIAVADILRLILKRIPGKVHDFFFSKVGYVFVGIFLTALVGGMSAYGIAHSHIVKVNPYEVTIRKNCGDNSDLKVVLIADLHLGYSVGDRQMQRMGTKRSMNRMRIWSAFSIARLTITRKLKKEIPGRMKRNSFWLKTETVLWELLRCFLPAVYTFL